MRWLRRAWQDVHVTLDDLRRVGILLLVCALCAALMLDFSRAPTGNVSVGDVAARTVKAPFTFSYEDLGDFERRRELARESEPPVFKYTPSHATERSERIKVAFAAARTVLATLLAPPEVEGSEQPQPEAPTLDAAGREAVAKAFRAGLGVRLPAAEVEALLDADFPQPAEQLSVDLLQGAMSHYVLRDRKDLPKERGAVRVIEERGLDRVDAILPDLVDQVITPDEARQGITLAKLESGVAQTPWAEASAALARALVRSNLTYQPEWSEEYQRRAVSAVALDLKTVKRGTTLFREGDVLTELDVLKYGKLQEMRGGHNLAAELLAIGLFLLLLLASLYQFGANYLQGFSTRIRDVATAGVLLVLVAAMARMVVASADGVASLIGMEAQASSVWFVVPVAGAAMLVRLLLGVAWTVVFSFAAAMLCGMVMDFQALPVMFFLLSAVAGGGAVEGTRERMAVLRAGLYAGLVNAAAVLLIHFLQLFLLEGEVTLSTSMRPVWSMSFAFCGGLFSAFLVLGLTPLFEAFGFVTDYRMMELANLNHPLMRQVMLRAPGTYHHSVMVGSLAEAGCEAIGANALEAKVASYFHDIGKSKKPAYFIENQKGGLNKHDKLSPQESAQVIIGHVIEGGRMAKEYGLPKPIVDNIHMHHGDGLLQYFYHRARELADDPSTIDPKDFRYPGPKPSSREAGVVMLADKVEAATRTIKLPTEANVRRMINKIVSSVIQDGQFDNCPLTFQEISRVSEVFISVLMGIYHQRIEYADTKEISSGEAPAKGAVITLDLDRDSVDHDWSEQDAPDPKKVITPDGNDGDYEALRHLPKERKH